MKISHISDLHLSTFFKQNNLKEIEYLLQYVLSQKVDHIAITGDLTNNADPGDFLILRSLFKKLDILNPERLSIIIGNHDIFGGVERAEDIFTFPEKCRQLDYHTKVTEFVDYFSEAFEKCESISEVGYFPFIKIIDDIQFIGVNSVAEYSRVKNPFASNGEISLEKFNELSGLLEQYNSGNEKRIVLIHHHFNKMEPGDGKKHASLWQNIEKQTMKLKKKKRLLNLLQIHEIDLVLHGHYHVSNEYERKEIKFLNAGASIINTKPNILHANFIEINGNEIRTEIHQIESNTSKVINKALVLNEPDEKEKNLAKNLVLN